MQAKNAAHSHCHRCGTAYQREVLDQEWPKRCPNCNHLQFVNPLPIGVMLQTVTDGDRVGILTPIRGHAPMAGAPGITGGFQEITDQGSEDAGAREKWEEVGRSLGLTQVDPDLLELLCTRATGPFIPELRQNLVFSVNPVPIHVSTYDRFVPDAETAAIHFSWAPEVLAFPSHTYALAKYFQRYQGVEPPEAYLRQPRTGDIIDANGILMPIFNVPYEQPQLDEGLWHVEFEDGGQRFPVRHDGRGWVG